MDDIQMVVHHSLDFVTIQPDISLPFRQSLVVAPPYHINNIRHRVYFLFVCWGLLGSGCRVALLYRRGSITYDDLTITSTINGLHGIARVSPTPTETDNRQREGGLVGAVTHNMIIMSISSIDTNRC
jgi:hypothetical protein